MKSLNRIINTVFNKPWLILPSVHQAYSKQLINILEGKVEYKEPKKHCDPMEQPMEQQVEDTVETVNGWQFIEIEGTICKGMSQMEMECGGGGCDIDDITEQLLAARDNANVTGIVLEFNTPGGTVTGVPECAALIKEITAIKPVVGYCSDMCCSAGYWLASQCSVFYCSPSSTIGSVGAYTIVMDESAAYDMAGVKVNAFKSGKYKLSGASFQPMTDEEKTMFQADIDKLGKEFRSVVSSNRPDIKAEDMEAQCYDGNECVDNGYADGLIDNEYQLIEFLQTTQ